MLKKPMVIITMALTFSILLAVQGISGNPGKSELAASSDKRGPARKLYDQALSAYKDKDYKKGITLFQAFGQCFPEHSLADNALYWMGECFYAQGDFSGAVFLFKKMLKTYPRSNKTPDALLKIGYAYLILKNPVDAKQFLTRLTLEYPKSPARAKADVKLKRIR